MKFVSMTNQTVATTLGHTLAFQAGMPTHVPKMLHKAVRAAGIVAEDDMPVEVRDAILKTTPGAKAVLALKPLNVEDEDEPDTLKQVEEPTDPEERQEAFFVAFKAMLDKGDRSNFVGNGAPHNRPLSDVLGFRVNAVERDQMWAKFNDQSQE